MQGAVYQENARLRKCVAYSSASIAHRPDFYKGATNSRFAKKCGAKNCRRRNQRIYWDRELFHNGVDSIGKRRGGATGSFFGKSNPTLRRASCKNQAIDAG